MQDRENKPHYANRPVYTPTWGYLRNDTRDHQPHYQQNRVHFDRPRHDNYHMRSKESVEFQDVKVTPRRFKDDSDVGTSTRTQSFFKEDMERATPNRFQPRNRDFAQFQQRPQFQPRGGYRGGYQNNNRRPFLARPHPDQTNSEAQTSVMQ